MTSGFWRFQKWLVIYNAIVDPRPVSEIAKHTGLSISTVCDIIAEYNKMGPESIDHPSRKGRRRNLYDIKEEIRKSQESDYVDQIKVKTFF